MPKSTHKPNDARSIRESSRHPTRTEVYRAAKRYIASGLSLMPIMKDGSKRPVYYLLPIIDDPNAAQSRRSWKLLRDRLPTSDELREWFRDEDDAYGMGILTGKASSNLEVIDLDEMETALAFLRLVRSKCPKLYRRLVLVRSPRPGVHVYYRCDTIEKNQKLAMAMRPTGEPGKTAPKAIIETRGEGGMILAPPSPGNCHRTGRNYRYLSKHDLTEVPRITPAQRDKLMKIARKFNEWSPPPRPVRTPPPGTKSKVTGIRPGDVFNRKATWPDVLEPHGWTFVDCSCDGTQHWCRPGKPSGTSATVDFGDSDLLRVFSSNATPLEADRSYTKFSVYAALNHGGDFKAASKALRAKGYFVPEPFTQRRCRSANPTRSTSRPKTMIPPIRSRRR